MKILTIALKDTLIRFRDRNAIILMLVVPIILSAIIGSAFGGFIQNGSAPFDQIPVLVVNQDEGELGEQMLTTLQGGDLESLLDVQVMQDVDEVRETVQLGDARAGLVIPTNFTQSITEPTSEAGPAVVQFYADPGATLTPNIVRSIVVQILNGFNTIGIATEVTFEQLFMTDPVAAAEQLEQVTLLFDTAVSENLPTAASQPQLNRIAVGDTETAVDISPFAFFAPSMGMLFLMFSMMDGTRSILDEEKEGTLGRLISTPTSYREILMGKIGGVFLTGILQFFIFVIASSLLFQLDWGNSILGLVVMTVAMVLSLTSLGAFIAAFARDLNQANILGTIVTLTFAALGGNFVPAQNFPPFLEQLSKLTITRWGLDGLTDLTIRRLGVESIFLEAGVLFGLCAIFLILALFQFQRRVVK